MKAVANIYSMLITPKKMVPWTKDNGYLNIRIVARSRPEALKKFKAANIKVDKRKMDISGPRKISDFKTLVIA
jgi:hypothetical protein